MKLKIPYLKTKLILTIIIVCTNNLIFSQHNHQNQGHQGHVHQSMRLAPDSNATHRAVQSGMWNDVATWGGAIPSNEAKVIIPKSITVTVNDVFEQRLSTIRVDGTLNFSTEVNTQLYIETLVTMPHSNLIIGTENDPIKQGVEARILILDNGDINIHHDSSLLSRGIIALGKVEWHGAKKTSFVKANQWFPAGTSSFELEKTPLNWNIGDRIVLSGIFQKQQEEFTIKNMVGTTITLDHPTKNNRTIASSNEAFKGLYPYVANYSRNIIIESENKTDVHRRGHIMFMHQQEVDMKYVQLEELGRTNKAIELEKPVISPTTNVVGRYALHFHRAGDTDKNGKSGYVQGCVVWGSPGWGFVNHESNVWFDDNASYNVLGSHFTDENGSELGGFRRNIAIYSKGSVNNTGDWNEKLRQNGDHGHSGIGFWATTGATVRWDGNVATDQNFTGFAIISRRAPDDLHKYDYSLHDNPSQGGGQKLVNAKHVGINFFKNSVNYGGVNGLAIVDLELNGKYNTDNVFENFTSMNTIGWNGLAITYMRNLHLKNVKVLRDDVMPLSRWNAGQGIYASATYDHLFKVATKGWTIAENVTIYGFRNGFQLLRDNPGTPNQRDDNKLYLDTKSSFFINDVKVVDIMDAAHFKDNVDPKAIPERPYFSVTPGVHNEEVQFKIISEPGSTVYYSYGEVPSYLDSSIMKDLDLDEAHKYNGETITFNANRTAIFAVAVKDGLQSRVQSGWYYVEDTDEDFVAVSDIELKNFEAIKLVSGNTISAPNYHLFPSNATNKSVKWSSSNENVVTVHPDTGVITAIANGEADIILTSVSNEMVFDSTKVIVSDTTPDTDTTIPVTGITINETDVTLNIGEEITVEAGISPSDATNQNIVWSSSNENIIAVNPDTGAVTAIAQGEADLIVTLVSNEMILDSIKVIVSKTIISVTEITINQADVTLNIGEEMTVEAEVSPSDATNRNIVWSSSNEEIAYVNDLGEVIALSVGNTIINVKTEDGNLEDSITVSVKEEAITNNYVTYQGEDRTRQVSTRNRNDISGFTGTGFVDFGGKDSFIEWGEVRVSESGKTKFLFTYSNGSDVDRSCELFIDGTSYGVLDFATVVSGNWSVWNTVEKTIDLAPGTYKVQLITFTHNGGPNFDKMELVKKGKLASEFTIQMFPNPTSTQQVTIETEDWEGTMVRIFDQQASLKLELNMTNKMKLLDVSNLLPGVFIVEVKFVTGSKIRKKLIIKN